MHQDFKSKTIDTLFTGDLKSGLEDMCKEADKAIAEGVTALILSDRKMDGQKTPIPALLAVSALHQYLVRAGKRTKVSIIAQSGEAREVHHFAALIGYGADAIHPYLTYATYKKAIEEGALSISYEEAVTKYSKSVTEGVVKVMSKMGISTVQSYRGRKFSKRSASARMLSTVTLQVRRHSSAASGLIRSQKKRSAATGKHMQIR